MKKKIVIVLLFFTVVVVIIGISFLFSSNIAKNKNKLEIIDATYMCNNSVEKFYEDNEYTYSFPCVKSDSVYVKFENGNKMLVVDALKEKKVTIDELIAAGLDVYKNEK